MASRLGWLAIALVLAGCVGTPVASTVTSASPAPVASETPAPENTPSQWIPPRIGVDEAYQRVQKGEDIVIVDVRGEASYQQEHIVGAVNVPWVNLKEKYGLLPKDKLLLLYCTWPNEHSSAGAAQDLHDFYGYANMLVLLGGMQGWVEKGYPTVKASPSPVPSP